MQVHNMNQLHRPPVSTGMAVNDVNVNYQQLYSSFSNMSSLYCFRSNFLEVNKYY